MNWKFWEKPAPVERQIEVVRRDSTTLTLDEWRSDPKVCAAAAKVLADPTVRMMLDVLRNNHLGMMVLPMGSSLEVRACVQSLSEGYSMCLNNLEAMAIHKPVGKDLQPTFEPEEESAQ